MLALKQALSLVSTKPISSTWTPTDESTLQAWYQNKVGIILNGSDVKIWYKILYLNNLLMTLQ